MVEFTKGFTAKLKKNTLRITELTVAICYIFYQDTESILNII